MKKTKLLTSLAALALVLGLGACTTTEDETPTESESSTTSEETSEPTDTTPSTSTPEDDGGEDVEGYTIVFTLYDTTGAVQTAPEYGSLYFQGSPTGSWNESGWWEWGDYALLSETTNEKGEVAYGCTFDLETLNTGSDHAFNIVFAYEGEEPSWAPVRESNFSIVIPDEIAIGDVQYVECTGCYTLADQFGVKGASCTIAVKDTADSGSDRTLYCSGTMNGWDNSNKMTYDASGTDYQYSYTFDCSENQELTLGIFNNSSWADSLQIGTDTDATGYCSNSSNNVVVSGNAIGSNANTLIIFTVDGTGFGGTTHVTTTAITITHTN